MSFPICNCSYARRANIGKKSRFRGVLLFDACLRRPPWILGGTPLWRLCSRGTTSPRDTNFRHQKTTFLRATYSIVEKFAFKKAKFGAKNPPLGGISLGAELKFWAPIIFSVGNSYLSVRKFRLHALPIFLKLKMQLQKIIHITVLIPNVCYIICAFSFELYVLHNLRTELLSACDRVAW